MGQAGEPSAEGRDARARVWARWLGYPAAALVVGVLAWAGVRISGVTEVPLEIAVRSDKLVTGAVSYSTVIPKDRVRVRTIRPEQVTPEPVEQEVTVTVTPLARRNSGSRGGEVWVRSLASAVETIDGSEWAGVELPPGWVVEADAALSRTDTSQPLEVQLTSTGYVDITMLTHPWSGTVRLSASESSRVVDLYSSDSTDREFRVLLPVDTDSTQRISSSVPSIVDSLTVTFTNGPRSVWLEGLALGGETPWRWSPRTAKRPSLGPRVRVAQRDGNALMVVIAGEEGSVSFSGLRPEPFWELGLADYAFIVLVAALALASFVGFEADARTPGFWSRLWSTSPGRAPHPTRRGLHSSEPPAPRSGDR